MNAFLFFAATNSVLRPMITAGTLVIGASVIGPVRSASAQATGATEQHQHQELAKPTGAQPADHSQMDHQNGSASRDASGTSWLPDASLMYARHAQRGSWMLMAHGNAFLQYLDDGGERGVDQLGSINWFMGMADRSVGRGHLGLRAMFSLEPATIGGCGYPDLLASGELCDGEPIIDRQHQHDLFMELAATYDRPLMGSVRWQIYGGPAGEPALGPAAYPHRISAMPNLLAPISHHWLDSTHITFGVVTAGVYGRQWKAEISAFNGREPDQQRTGLDLAPLDSVSGRMWYLPSDNLSLQFSAGQLNEAEPGEDGGPRIDVSRLTASATYHRLLGDDGIWATTAAWGANTESEQTTHALLVETNYTLRDRDSWFGRFEIVGKTAHDLDLTSSLVHDVEGDEVFTVSKLQGGYTRYFTVATRLKAGLGFTASAGFVPEDLEAEYGSRINPGFGVFVTIRPAAMQMPTMSTMPDTAAPGAPHEHRAAKPEPGTPAAPPEHAHPEPGAKPTGRPSPGKPEPPAGAKPTPSGEAKLPVLPAERIIDPDCAQSIDLIKAPRAIHQGKVYYFCSERDRDEFLKDPAAYMKKRGWR
jgi:YHS domain-containing protein